MPYSPMDSSGLSPKSSVPFFMTPSRRYLAALLLVIFGMLPFAGCTMFIPLSDFEDGRSLDKGEFRTAMSVEEGYLYRNKRGKDRAESRALFTSVSAGYGLVNGFGITYATWYGSVPFAGGKIALPISLVRTEGLTVGLTPSILYESNGIGGESEDMSLQNITIASVALPIGYRWGSGSIYCAPRLWESIYNEGWYNTVTLPNGTKQKVDDGRAKTVNDNVSVALGVSYRFDRFTVVPEAVWHSVAGKQFVTGGVRFGMSY